MLFVLVPTVPIRDPANEGGILEKSDTSHLTTEDGAKAAIAKMMAAMAAKAGAGP
jgi:hypothetical protein